jgi:hypothetical protein
LQNAYCRQPKKKPPISERLVVNSTYKFSIWRRNRNRLLEQHPISAGADFLVHFS